jgi:predicted DNA-binding transcriptional regulator AlpA
MSKSTNPNDDREIFHLKVSELKHILIDALDSKLSETKKEEKSINHKMELVPRLDVAREFQVSVVSLDKWVKYGQFPKPIKQGSRVYFKRSDIDLHLTRKGGCNEF